MELLSVWKMGDKKNYLTSQRGKKMVILTSREIHELERSRGVWEKSYW